MILLTLFFVFLLLIMGLVVGILNQALPKNEAPVKEQYWKKNYKQILGLCVVFSGLFAVLMYRNMQSFTYSICVLVYLVVVRQIAGKLQVSLGKSAYICGGIMLAAALTTALTYNKAIHGVNHLIIFGGAMVYVLLIFLEKEKKDVNQWFRYLVLLICHGITSSFCGITHLKYLKDNEEGKESKIKYIVLGICLGVPFMLIVLFILATADAIFADMFESLFQWEQFADMIFMFFIFVIMFFVIYGATYGAIQVAKRQVPKSQRKGEPVVAITIAVMIAVIYALFCFVQIRYLFLGGAWSLPEGFTYAEYARTGFFQLLFVSILNYICVIVGTYTFKESKMLRGILLFISICTYIMMASSFYRMILYVKAYHLTFLRVVVLCFLTALAVLFGLLIYAMYHPKMNLLQWTAVTAACFYLVFAFAKPDYWVALYNTTVDTEFDDYDWYELAEDLSWDAAPVLLHTQTEASEYHQEYYEEKQEEYRAEISEKYEKMGIRKFNVSLYMAGKHAKTIGNE